MLVLVVAQLFFWAQVPREMTGTGRKGADRWNWQAWAPSGGWVGFLSIRTFPPSEPFTTSVAIPLEAGLACLGAQGAPLL